MNKNHYYIISIVERKLLFYIRILYDNQNNIHNERVDY